MIHSRKKITRLIPVSIALMVSLSLLSTQHLGAQVDLDETDERAVAVINQFMEALMSGDFDSSAKAVLPFVHASLQTADRSSMDQDTLNYQFKKAQANAQFYRVPVQITRVQELRTTEIGHPSRGNYQKGTERKYWIAKKEGQAGLPAPLVVFFPEDGGQPTISYMGSL
ncbi:MAG: hypothetical protein KDK34_13905 [Leptospiraceae bacterium]|nr:hypothetical protein [Leptospiraceae bacterium]